MDVFNTTRPAPLNAKLNQMMQDKMQRDQNRAALEAQIAMEQREAELQKSIDEEARKREANAAKESALEQAAQRMRLQNADKALLDAKLNMPTDGEKIIIKDIICDIVTEGLWIDDNVKNADGMREKIMEQVDAIIAKCEEITGKSLVESMSNTKLLSYIDNIAKDVSATASNRIITEASEVKDVSINFNLSSSEKDDLDAKMDDIDTDKIAAAVKDKVLDVIKKESEAGKVKAELFKELDDAEKQINGDNEEEETPDVAGNEVEPVDDTDDDADEVAESLIGCNLSEALNVIENKQAEQMNPYKTYPIRVLVKLADKTAITGKIRDAQKIYLEAAERCHDFVNHMETYNNNDYTTMMESIDNATDAVLFHVAHYQHKVKPKTSFSKMAYSGNNGKKTLGTSLGMLETYCRAMEWSIGNNNIVTETFEQQMAKVKRHKIQQALRDTVNESLFDNLMIKNLNAVTQSHPVNADGIQLLESEMQNAAFMQTVLDYTILETLNTMNIYRIDNAVVSKLKDM